MGPEMLHKALFGLMMLMTLTWFICVEVLTRRLKTRHFRKYEETNLGRRWPASLRQALAGYDNRKATFGLLRFLFRREDAGLGDAGLSRLATFMRWLCGVYLIAFVWFFVWTMAEVPWRAAKSEPARAAEVESDTAVDQRNQAFRLHREGKLEEAIAAYDDLLFASPDDAKLHYWRGDAYLRLKDLDRALRDMRVTIDLDSGYFDAYLAADYILFQSQQWDAIIDLWDRYIFGHPENAEAYYQRAGTKYHKGDLRASREDAQKACDLGKKEGCSWAQRLTSR